MAISGALDKIQHLNGEKKTSEYRRGFCVTFLSTVKLRKSLPFKNRVFGMQALRLWGVHNPGVYAFVCVCVGKIAKTFGERCFFLCFLFVSYLTVPRKFYFFYSICTHSLLLISVSAHVVHLSRKFYPPVLCERWTRFAPTSLAPRLHHHLKIMRSPALTR